MTYRKLTLAIILLAVVVVPVGMVTRTMLAMSVITSNHGRIEVMGVIHKGKFATSVHGSLWATYLGMVHTIEVNFPDDEKERQRIWNAIRQLNVRAYLGLKGRLTNEDLDKVFVDIPIVSLNFTDCELGDAPFREASKSTTIRSISLWNTVVTETNLRGLEDIPNLKSVHIMGPEKIILDNEFVNGANRLESLSLKRIRFQDGRVLPPLPQLRTLRLRECEIDLGDLSRFPLLEEITSDQADKLNAKYGQLFPQIKINSYIELDL